MLRDFREYYRISLRKVIYGKDMLGMSNTSMIFNPKKSNVKPLKVMKQILASTFNFDCTGLSAFAKVFIYELFRKDRETS